MSGPASGWSLTARLAVAMAAVAVLSAVLAGLLIAPLLRGAGERAVREPLARQAQLLARLPERALLSARVDRLAEGQGLALGVVSSSGTVSGAAEALDAEQRRVLLDGGPVSASGVLDGEPVLVEAQPIRPGGAVVLAASTSDVGTTVARMRHRVLLALGLGLLAALVAATVVARRIGRPLTQTAAAARLLAEGHRGVPLPVAGTREVADVTEALGHLDAALRTSEDRQRRFLLSVSHELRTPLTAIRGYAEALVDGAVAPEETTEVGRTLVGESLRLQRYVDDLLALARLESDDFRLDPEPSDLVVLVRAAAAAWQDRCDRAGLTLRSVVPAGEVVVHTDPGRVRQVLDALVDNAVRVCPGGASVVLALSESEGAARLEVRDSGPGLTPEDLGVAFEPGALHDRYAGSRPVGHGLGLAIVHGLVARLGGTVEVGSAPEGGAAFSITLPR